MTKTKVFETLLKAKKIAIFGHVNPDPDALGSMFAMRDFLREQSKVAEVFVAEREKNFLNEIFPLQEAKADFVANDFDLVLCVDMHAFQRIDAVYQEEVKKAKKIVVIDHHEISGKEEMICKDVFSEPEKAATCEIVTDLFIENKVKISKQMATYLWTGLVGDTGRFLHNNLTENVLKVAQILKKSGADDQFVYDKMYRSVTMKELQLQKFSIDKINLIENGRAGYSIFTLKEMKRLGVPEDSIHGIAERMVKIAGVEVAFFAKESEKNVFKLSIRTNGLNSLIVSTSNGGGGHKQASGF